MDGIELLIMGKKYFNESKRLNSRRLILFQAIVNLFILYHTIPVHVQCRDSSFDKKSPSNIEPINMDSITVQDICSFNIRPALTSNVSLTFVGMVLVLLLYSKEKFNKNEIAVSKFIDCSIGVYIWVLLSIQFLNPVRISFNHSYSSSGIIISTTKMMLSITFYIFSLPISMFQTLSTLFDNVIWTQSPHQLEFYQINYNWSAIFVVISFAMQCLLLQNSESNEKFCIRKKSEKKLFTESTRKGEIEVVEKGKPSKICTNLKRQYLHEELSKDKPINGALKNSKYLNHQAKPKPEIADKPNVIPQTTNIFQERPLLLDSPTKPKPVNVTKPLTINVNTSPKNIRKSLKTNKGTQTNIDVIYLKVDFKDKNTQTLTKNLKTREVQTEIMSSFLNLFLRKPGEGNDTEHKNTQTSLTSKNSVTQTETKDKPTKNIEIQTVNKSKVCDVEVQFNSSSMHNLLSKSSQTEIKCDTKSSQKDKQCDLEYFTVNDVEKINIMPNEVKLKDSSTQIEISKSDQVIQVDNTPSSSFSYDKAVQCHFDEEVTKLKPVESSIKSTQTDDVYDNIKETMNKKVERLVPTSTDDKEIQTIINTSHLNEILKDKVSKLEQNDKIEQVAMSITKLTKQLSKDTEPIQFSASKSQNNVWYVSLRSDLFLSLSYDILKYLKLNKEETNPENLNITTELIRIMKIYADNYNKLSTCFEDDNESDDESFINGFRL